MLSDGIMKKSVSLNSVGLARDARDSVPPWENTEDSPVLAIFEKQKPIEGKRAQVLGERKEYGIPNRNSPNLVSRALHSNYHRLLQTNRVVNESVTKPIALRNRP